MRALVSLGVRLQGGSPAWLACGVAVGDDKEKLFADAMRLVQEKHSALVLDISDVVVLTVTMTTIG